ncbi:MAG: 1-acyl-sn-glycerol-3-phosphate acyltransferase, partial [Spirulinaceae cyanobacterium]
AMGKLAKQEDSVPNLYLVPVSIKYRYTGNTTKLIENSLSSLETALDLTQNTEEFYPRLRSLAGQVLTNIEQEYKIESKGIVQEDWNQRIKQLKSRILQVCEEKLSCTTSDQLQLRERVYKIHHVLESSAEELTKSDYQFIRNSLIRLLNFDAIYDGYVATAPTPERFLDTLTRLEREVFNVERPRPKGHRQAIVHVGEPVNLKDYFDSYKLNKEETVQTLTLQMQQAVQDNLDLLQQKYLASF